MKLESIQIGVAQPTPDREQTLTGFFKRPVASAQVTTNGVANDVIADLVHHGGVDQAVYVYTRDDYEAWERELGRTLPGGSFGENLTIVGISSADVMVGDHFTLGSVVLEASSARIPCNTFKAAMDEPGWVERFRHFRRPGFYARVIAPGEVTVGQLVTHTGAQATISILETLDLYYDPNADVSRLEAALASPIAIRNRDLIQRRMAPQPHSGL